MFNIKLIGAFVLSFCFLLTLYFNIINIIPYSFDEDISKSPFPTEYNSSSLESILSLIPPYTFHTALENSKNLIFIGDVHGALSELQDLLKLINYDKTNDHLVFVGDLVAKGPNSIEVVKYIKNLSEKGDVSCVRGNHDHKVLRLKVFLNAFDSNNIKLDEYAYYKILEELNVKQEHLDLARNIDEVSYEFLLSCPIVIEIPEESLYVVHAGLLPNVPIEEQDPDDIMTMRNIKSNGQPTDKKKTGKPWTDIWNFYQKSSDNPKYIIYGHDASRGLTIKDYSFGLDSRCVAGEDLTALLWSKDKTLMSVKCKNFIKKG
ncbi:hypothetical protein Glove_212g13 [Diversispora epigaea]|uniref:Calcineurin-like phosphoesterase domain-containing protein n=1 Tax=Diversispora epigaea TaxID=1348612 RepID=A0A397IKY5_9GLOM|nr:hypothetical protein Glove_212g13 [Diversispora epigaea]